MLKPRAVCFAVSKEGIHSLSTVRFACLLSTLYHFQKGTLTP